MVDFIGSDVEVLGSVTPLLSTLLPLVRPSLLKRRSDYLGFLELF